METLVTIERALEIVRQTAVTLATEWVPLLQAYNRILSEDLTSKVDDPPFDNSAMDGWAVRSIDEQRLEVGTTAAGTAPLKVKAGEAIRIMTGAPMPEGADAIVLIEDGLQGKAHTNFIRRQGENLSQGTVALQAGQIMTPAAISLAATMGHATIPVRVKPRVAVISTGDELVAPGDELEAGSIYESNSYGLCALLEKIGCAPFLQEVVVDSLDALRSTLNSLDCDVILTSGGVSMGEFDYVRKLMELEGDIHFWKVAMRPGKPVMFGELNGVPVLGLPGNPVSVIVCALIFLLPVIRRLLGLPIDLANIMEKAFLNNCLPENDERQDYLRGTLNCKEDGSLWASPFQKQDSSMLSVLARADCLIVRAPHAAQVSTGELVDIIRFPSSLIHL